MTGRISTNATSARWAIACQQQPLRVYRFVTRDSGPILDAGCGGGLQTEPLVLAGYGLLVGIDFSPGMLSVARAKGIYEQLHCMALGEPLDFADGQLRLSTIGTLTPGHAPAESYDELLRVTRPGGLVVLASRRCRSEFEFPAAVEHHTEAGHWDNLCCNARFQSMPYGEPEITHQIHVPKDGASEARHSIKVRQTSGSQSVSGALAIGAIAGFLMRMTRASRCLS